MTATMKLAVIAGAVLLVLAFSDAAGERRRVRIRTSTRNRERHEAIPGLVNSDADLAIGAASAVLRRAESPSNRLDDDAPVVVNSSPVLPTRRRLPAATNVTPDALARRRSRLPSRRKSATDLALTKDDSKAVADPNKKYKIVCYYTNWSQYRPEVGKFMPEDIDPHLCTHVIFAFGWLKKGKLSSFESNDETKDGKVGLYEKIATLKEANPELKNLLAIGGWSFGTQKFKDMSKTRYARQIFIFSAIPFLREHKFDGLDIDWEYPKGKDDKKNYVALLKELREAFDAEAQEFKRPRLLLSAAVPVGPDNVKSGYDVPAVSSYLDFINLMAYDFHGKWEQQAGHNAPLVAPSSDSEWRKQLSVTHAADMWVRLGAPKDKLVIGMPTYGRTFTLSNPANYHVNAPASGGGNAGKYTKESGFLAYYEVCEMLQAGAKYVWDDEMKVPYLVDGDQWVGFDDEKAIRNKMQWLKNEGYAGAMVWTLDMDDFTGKVCGNSGGKYPLISAMREELNNVPRSPAYKDIEWAKESKKSEIARATTTPPPPEKISVEELLKSAGLDKSGKPSSKTKLALDRSSIEGDDLDDKSLNAPKVFCYFTNWSTRRPGKGRFEPESIDPFMCTHIVYAFATLEDFVLAPGEDTDVGDGVTPGLYSRIQGLREANPNLKILLAIGGWAFGSKPFKELTENLFRMNTFVYDALEFLREYQFDGLDIDWEYPRGAEDKANYARLIKELRTAFEGEAESTSQPRLILSAAVPASFEAVAAGYDVPEISKYLDYINVMTYDFHGQWERQVGHNSPLFALESASKYQKKLTVDFSAREWIRQGAPKEKLLIGMPTYGRSFTLVDETKFDIGAPASGGGSAGEFTGEEGFLAYYEVCDFLHQDNVTLVWDNEQQVPFAYRQDQWVGFDDERSLKTKMEWLKEMGFGGVMIWSVDMDDFRGTCGMGKFPLINAINSGLEGYRVKYTYEGPYDGPSVYQTKKKKNPNEVVCEEADGHISYHRDYADCRKYYMCEGERKHHMPCPSNLVFNPDQSVCDWPENVAHCSHLAPKKEEKR